MFGLLPTVSRVSWILAALVVAASVIFSSSWRFRVVMLAFAVPEFLALPWPAACFAAAASYGWTNRSRTREPAAAQRQNLNWWRRLLLVAVGGASGGVVVLLDIRQIQAGYTFPLPIPPPALLPVMALVAAVVNALGEELLWRRVLLDLGRQEPRFGILVLSQALSFGVAHYFGIPPGFPGALAATAYSTVLFLVSRRYGFRQAVVVHISTDIVIFLIVLQNARFAWSG